MTLSEKTELQLFTEFKNNQEAVQANAAWINAHEAYAQEFGGMALCGVGFGGVTPRVMVADVSDMQVSRPVRMIGYKPVYEVAYNGFVLNVVEK